MTEFRVALEVGRKKTFASGLDWPGWSRAGKDTPDAIDELLSYRERYNEVVQLAGIVPVSGDPLTTSVIDRVVGDSTTDFGAPGKLVDADRAPIGPDELARQASLLRGCWTYFDKVAAVVSSEMRKGPRGGGRDRDAIIDHTLEAERTYGRKIGVRTPRMAIDDAGAIHSHRAAIVQALTELSSATEISERGWPPRYAIRRMAWHVLDHAWEMQDKDLS